MAIIRLISMNDKKYEFGDEHEYQQLQSGSNSSSERNSYVSFSFFEYICFSNQNFGQISCKGVSDLKALWRRL